MSNTNSITASAKGNFERGEHGHFKPGYVGTMIRNAEERQRQRAQVAANIEHQLWLAEHGLDDVSPDEIFA
jgi:hypothetical protein